MAPFTENLNCSWTESSERLFATPENEIKSFLPFVQEAGCFSTFAPYYTEREGLHSFLILLTLSGKGRLTQAGNTYTLQAGDVFFIDCAVKHRYETVPPDTWDFLWVHCLGPTVKGYCNYFAAQRGGLVAHVQTDTAEKLMREVLRVGRSEMPQRDVLSADLLGRLLNELLLSAAPARHSANTAPDLWRKILAEVDKTCCGPLKAQDVAKQFGVDACTLSRNFKRYFGVGFKQYVTEQRLVHAKALLLYSDKSVADIAEELGWENPEHFIALFKKSEALTPLRYRKKYRATP